MNLALDGSHKVLALVGKTWSSEGMSSVLDERCRAFALVDMALGTNSVLGDSHRAFASVDKTWSLENMYSTPGERHRVSVLVDKVLVLVDMCLGLGELDIEQQLRV